MWGDNDGYEHKALVVVKAIVVNRGRVDLTVLVIVIYTSMLLGFHGVAFVTVCVRDCFLYRDEADHAFFRRFFR